MWVNVGSCAMTPSKTILLVVADDRERGHVEAVLRAADYSVSIADSADAALDWIIRNGAPALILVGLPLAGMEPDELLYCVSELCDSKGPPAIGFGSDA